MPIHRDKARGQWVFEFDRVIPGRGRFRTRRRLPKTWSRAQADAYDRTAVGDLYAEAAGIAPRQRPTIERAVALYLTDKADQKRAAETARELQRIRFAYRGKAIDELPAVARAIAAHAERTGWSPATARNRIAYLRAACRWAWKRHGLTEHDPGGRVVVPAVRNERTNFLDRAEVLRAARKIRNRAARAHVLVAFYSGMRLDETQRAVPLDGAWTLDDTKNGERRHVPIGRKVAVYARRWPRDVARITIQSWTRKGFDAIGRPDASFHTLRHSTATAILATGGDLGMVGDVLGHRDPRSSKRYAHRQVQHMAAALEKLGGKSPTTGGGPREKAA